MVEISWTWIRLYSVLLQISTRIIQKLKFNQTKFSLENNGILIKMEMVLFQRKLENNKVDKALGKKTTITSKMVKLSISRA